MKRSMQAQAHRWAFNAGKWNPTEEEWKLAASCVQPEEKTRIGRFMFKDDAKLSMAGRLMMRRSISQALGIPPEKILLKRTKRNKPFLDMPTEQEQAPRFNFNISHAGDYVVLAASHTRQIGVDVMDVRKPLNETTEGFFRLMDKQFTQNEWSNINEPIAEMDRLHMFYRYWSLKESYIKAVGDGLHIDLQRLDFRSDNALTPQTRDPVTNAELNLDGVPAENWQFSQAYIDSEHCISVAFGPSGDNESNDELEEELKMPIEILSFKDLVKNSCPLSEPDDEYWEKFSARKNKPSRR